MLLCGLPRVSFHVRRFRKLPSGISGSVQRTAIDDRCFALRFFVLWFTRGEELQSSFGRIGFLRLIHLFIRRSFPISYRFDGEASFLKELPSPGVRLPAPTCIGFLGFPSLARRSKGRGLGAFPAVYRTPSPFGHLRFMDSPKFSSGYRLAFQPTLRLTSLFYQFHFERG